VSGCAVDRDAAPPWERAVTPPGASRCLVRVAWTGAVRYPAVLDPAWSSAGVMSARRMQHSATLLNDHRMLVAGGDSSGSAEIYDPSSHTWSVTGSLSTARSRHSAVLLPSGQVLVAGGSGTPTSDLASAETYNPASGTWQLVPSMVRPRSLHSATVLPTGQVLVAGGTSSGTLLPDVELYDPVANRWTTTESMSYARSTHTATLLSTGDLLVVGGSSGSASLSAVELYHLQTGSWSVVNSLANARARHTANLLANGRVLVTGGVNGSTVLASTELYDPSKGTWTATGNLNNGRYEHTATLLNNGQVMVTGGQPVTTLPAQLHATERYDPASGQWWAVSDTLATARALHTATLLADGNVLVAGGVVGRIPTSGSELYDSAAGYERQTSSMLYGGQFNLATLLPSGKVLVAQALGIGVSHQSELYDPAHATWTRTGDMNNLFSDSMLSAPLPNGKVLVAGRVAEVYDSATGQWSLTGPMVTPRRYATMTALSDGRVLIAGGDALAINGPGFLASAELYDPATNSWTATSNLILGRDFPVSALLQNGKVIVVAGWGAPGPTGGSVTGSAELYDPASGTWSPAGSLVTPRWADAAITLQNGKVIVVGGGTINGDDASTELYDPASNTWTRTGDQNTPRYNSAPVLLASGKVLLAGGETSLGSESPSMSAESYDPATGKWTWTAPLWTARTDAAATLLQNGLVLIAGGSDGGGAFLNSAELYTDGH
jgi:N-acetylneuraminic acid mutarotase